MFTVHGPTPFAKKMVVTNRVWHVMLLLVWWMLSLSSMQMGARGASTETIRAPTLEQVSEWDMVDGKSVRTSVFCSNKLGTIRTPTFPEANTLQALCNLTGLDYYSNSALDAFMAGRFAGKYSYGTAGLADPVWSQQNTKPFSTEANTPWVLADYIITESRSAQKADSWKSVAAEAQIDVLVCSDPTCKTLFDLQNINSRPGQSASRAIGYSGIKGVLQMGLATINQSMSSSVKEKQQWVPAELKVTSAGQPRIVEVAWHVENADLVRLQSLNPNYDLDLQDAISIRATHLQATRLGYYPAQFILGDYKNIGGDAPDCVAVMWPDHPWMHAHEWGYSDPLCTSIFKHIVDSEPQGTSNLPLVFFLNSYFPQARILSSTTRVLATIEAEGLGSSDFHLTSHYANFTASSGFGITEDTVAVFVHNTTALDAPVQPVSPQHVRNYSLIAGRFSWTLLGKKPIGVETQAADGCIRECVPASSDPLCPYECSGLCTVLSIGTATVNAVPIRRGIPGSFDWFVFLANNGVVLPWCAPVPSLSDDCGDMLLTSILAVQDEPDVKSLPISVFVDGISPPLLHNNGISRDFGPAALLHNCSFWDGLSVGFAHNGTIARSHGVQPSHEIGLVPAQRFLDASTQFWRIIEAPPPNGSGLIPFSQWLPFVGLDGALQRLVGDAALSLDSNLSQQLATTDFTKTWLGALLDMSLTVVAAVAMASGCSDIMTWLHLPLQRCIPVHAGHLARVLTCLIVCLSLVVAPAVTLVGEYAARASDSNTGKSSSVQILAKDSRVGEEWAGPYVVVGIVTLKMTTQYDAAGHALVWVNLALASCTAIMICIDLLWPGNPWRLQRQHVNHRRLLRQLAFKDIIQTSPDAQCLPAPPQQPSSV